MKTLLAACLLIPIGFTSAEARIAQYGGVAAEYCNKRGCFKNEHYDEQMKKLQEKNSKLHMQ